MNTISSHPNLFKIITLINVPQFKELLVNHPNQPLVNSVVHGLTHGFWPFAHTHYGIYPTTLDDSGPPPKTIEQTDFLCKQIQTETDSQCYSAPFGPDLLPRMYSTPILAVPKGETLSLQSSKSWRVLL